MYNSRGNATRSTLQAVPRQQDTHAVVHTEHRNSGIGAAFLSGDLDDDDNDAKSEYSQQSPRPSTIPRKNNLPANPASGGQQHSQNRSPLRVDTNIRNPPSPPRQVPQPQRQPPHSSSAPNNGPVPQAQRSAPTPHFEQPIPKAPRAAFMQEPARMGQPSILAPHPLQAPKVPIEPVLLRPSPTSVRPPGTVKFSERAIMRGNSEETLVSRSTAKGDEFWRRFSVFVKEEKVEDSNKPGQRSSWLQKNQASATRMKGCVWIVAIFILLGIGGVATLVWYMTHNNAPSVPKTLSGAADPSLTFSNPSTPTSSSHSSSSVRVLHTVTGDLPPPPTGTLPVLARAVGTDLVKRSFSHDSLRRRHSKARLD